MTLDDLHDELSAHLSDIEKCFTCKVQVAVLVRVPGNDEGDVLVGNIPLEEAKALLERSASRPRRDAAGGRKGSE